MPKNLFTPIKPDMIEALRPYFGEPIPGIGAAFYYTHYYPDWRQTTCINELLTKPGVAVADRPAWALTKQWRRTVTKVIKHANPDDTILFLYAPSVMSEQHARNPNARIVLPAKDYKGSRLPTGETLSGYIHISSPDITLDDVLALVEPLTIPVSVESHAHPTIIKLIHLNGDILWCTRPTNLAHAQQLVREWTSATYQPAANPERMALPRMVKLGGYGLPNTYSAYEIFLTLQGGLNQTGLTPAQIRDGLLTVYGLDEDLIDFYVSLT